MASGPLLRYSDKLYDILDDIGDSIAIRLMELESNPLVDNQIGVKYVDVSKLEWDFNVTIDDKVSQMKVGKFIRYFIGNEFSGQQVFDFVTNYNRVKVGKSPILSAGSAGTAKKVEVPEFKFNPKDIRSTFISLVTKTYPHGHEEDVVKFITPGLNRDEFGNYYKIIGKSNTMFTSHLDTADRNKSNNVNLYSDIRDDQEYIYTDRSTILGADDKAGVTIMMYMIDHNIPGVYYFFIGEERGGIGSGKVSSVFEKTDHLSGIKRCVSFDRRNYYSVITEQIGYTCCSDDFANALCKEYNKSGLKLAIDPTGIYTDSASFIEQISECTNVSVGYFNEHTGNEYQNISFLKKIAEASIKVDWESLPSVRKVGIDELILSKHKDFITDFRGIFENDIKLATEGHQAFIKLSIDNDVDNVYDDLLNLSFLLHKYKMDPDIYFDDDIIKIELR